MTAPPPEQRAGESKPPELRLLVAALIVLLQDLGATYRERGGQLSPDEAGRILALLAVLKRYRKHLMQEGAS